MFCPKCGYKVYPEETTCKICLTPLKKVTPATESEMNVAIKEMRKMGRQFISYVARKSHILLVIAGLAVILYGVSYYTSPQLRLKLNGVRLQHGALTGGPTLYLVGTHSETKSWAYRGDTMDTPLADNELNETGTVVVESRLGPQTGHTFSIKAKEWVKMMKSGETTNNQTVPLNHPSIAPASLILDSQGSILERRNASSIRVGRAIDFIFPLFPKGTQHQGSSWTEHLSWEDTIGEWQIGWEADLVWQLKDFEMCDQVACTKLLYQATLHPHIVRPAAWADKKVHEITFEGQSNGEALYNTRDKVLIGNSLQYSGKLSIQIPNLESVPEEERVGATVTEDPGTIVIQFSNKFDIQKPT
jgi:hypothetical protein